MSNRLSDFKAVLFDMDGTLYRVTTPLPAVNDVLRHLRSLRVQVACLTNNSGNTEGELAARLASMGITLEASSIHTAAHAMADYIRSRWGQPRVFNFAGEALPVALGEGVRYVTSLDEPCDAVAVGTHGKYYGHGEGYNPERAAMAMQLLRRGAQLVVGCADRVFPTPTGLEIGSGSWGAMFSYGADLPPARVHYAGKPTLSFFTRLCDRLHVKPGECLLVGDNLESDIGGGRDAGMKTALVLTGVTRAEDLSASPIRPDFVFDDLADLLTGMR
jgi:4-nitrophenyl phosphatase